MRWSSAISHEGLRRSVWAAATVSRWRSREPRQLPTPNSQLPTPKFRLRSCFWALEVGSWDLTQVADCGTVDHRAVGREARSVARAIPRLFGLVPPDIASQVRADRRASVYDAFHIAAHRDFPFI